MNLQTRVVNILTRPASEWPVIAAESTDVVSLYRDYIVILAAIPAVCMFVGLLIGVPFFGSLGVGFALRVGIMTYITALIGTYISAAVVEKLAPSFGSSGDTVHALKLVAYSYTPVWVAGVLYLLLALAPLTLIAAIYAVYIFYLGLTPLMKTPQDKIVPYMVVSAIVIIVINVVLQVVLRSLGGISTGYGGMF